MYNQFNMPHLICEPFASAALEELEHRHMDAQSQSQLVHLAMDQLRAEQ
jgi:hypothetical protein